MILTYVIYKIFIIYCGWRGGCKQKQQNWPHPFINIINITHQSMWNLQTCNKLISDKSQQRSYKIHRQKLEEMQPRLRIEQPYQPDFVYTKSKLNMSRRDRRIEIDRLNEILLKKMEAIREQQYETNKLRPQAQYLKTLNAHNMEQMNEQIASQNERICNKLMRTRSFYPTSNILEKTEQLDYIASNISFNARRANSMRNLHSARSRPKSSYTTNLSSQKKRSKENFVHASPSQQQGRRLFRSERPETAPMFSRSQKIIVPHSGRPRMETAKQPREE